MTSVETYSYKRFRRGARQNNIKGFVWFYDYGFLFNFRQVLGPKLTEWFIPAMPSHIQEGDGISFKTKTLDEMGLKKMIPPQQHQHQQQQPQQQSPEAQPQQHQHAKEKNQQTKENGEGEEKMTQDGSAKQRKTRKKAD